MSSWNYKGSSSSNPIDDEPIIPDIVEEFTSDDFYEDNADDQEIVPIPPMDYNPYGEVELQERMQFDSKEATVSAIKHYHITNGYSFNVVESKPHLYVAQCIHYNNGCQWRLRASYSKIRHHWEIKSIDGTHTCFSTLMSQDHCNLDSTQIASIVFHLVRTNPSIRIKSLVADIKSRYGYTVTYRRTWIAKEKAITMEYGDWDQSYNEVPRWLLAAQQTNPGTIFQLSGPPVNIDAEDGSSTYIMERCFWAFGPCIEGFKYCKPVVQVDGTFLTGRYHATLLTAIAQDGNRNIFPLAFAIVEGETNEALIWFFQLLREHVTPQPNLCLITNRGKGILSALRLEEIDWESDNLYSIYCIRHLGSNFNNRFKNADLKKQFIHLGTTFS